jgi:CD163 antigen
LAFAVLFAATISLPGTATAQCCEDGDLRLIGGTSEKEGRVEICIGNEWGTVCDDSFLNEEVTVACRLLGFGPGIAESAGPFGDTDAPIYLDTVQCLGHESSLLDCPNQGIGVHDCSHIEDVALACEPPVCGDVTGDLKFTATDALFTLRAAIGLEKLPCAEK